MPLEAIVALALAAGVAIAAYRNEKLGAALLVGVGVLTAVYLLLNANTAQVQPAGPASPSPANTQMATPRTPQAVG